MLVATTFDLWQKDVFFSAAEEVQESADILRTAYHAWLRVKAEGTSSDSIDEHRRDLQTALGTAKWQLEEFERAVRLSYGNCRDESRFARHREFVVAMESQISSVENALRESLEEGGRAPLCWINLNDQERDDLAVFLSSNVVALQGTEDESSDRSCEKVNVQNKIDAGCYFSGAYSGHTEGSCNVRDDIAVKIDADYAIEPNSMNVRDVRDDANSSVEQTSSSRRTCTSSNISRLEIIVPDDNDHMRASTLSMQVTPKVKEPRLSGLMRMKARNLINQVFRFSRSIQLKMRSPLRLRSGQSIRLTLALMLALVLFVPFIVYSA